MAVRCPAGSRTRLDTASPTELDVLESRVMHADSLAAVFA
jgi:hypothetical protein